jgi:hypothetical protein
MGLARPGKEADGGELLALGASFRAKAQGPKPGLTCDEGRLPEGKGPDVEVRVKFARDCPRPTNSIQPASQGDLNPVTMM